ncbi:MAG: GTP-binding protein [Verrucomicrobiales bacterium]|jgi:GTP-binding protein
MKITSAEFVTSAADLESCPESRTPEIAFIGRSNVGKSSLINYLTNREGLARTSSSPGHTTLINFFSINQKWTMVDLPGYGYAKRSKADREKFQAFVSDYLVNRQNLACVFILIDSRIPTQPLDIEFTEWVVNCSIPFVLVFTKTDKTKPTPLKKNIEAFKTALAERCTGTPVCLTSSTKSRNSKFEILDLIESTLNARGV